MRDSGKSVSSLLLIMFYNPHGCHSVRFAWTAFWADSIGIMNCFLMPCTNDQARLMRGSVVYCYYLSENL